MHLADGIITDPSLFFGLNLAGGVAFALAASRTAKGAARTTAWAGTLAAFVLAAQAINIPTLGGASAHVIGAGLMTVALGPARSIVAMGLVLLIQAALFADGGLTVLGINILNIAVIPSLITAALCRAFGGSAVGLATATGLGTLLGNLAGACSLSFALIAGAQSPWGLTLAWLLGVQAVAGLAEGSLAALAVRYLSVRAPNLLAERREPRSAPEQRPLGSPLSRRRRIALAVFAVGLTVLLVPVASQAPDALEVVLGELPTR